ncbi:MAG: CpsD/CapB family tyrosine-protein kinase [Clostridiales bacterium]|nr:CpsD/CapB family tyrosine-protein kinase [Clostridiales bacterium]MDY4008736.1 CpsD/CapB family tyrosine-protein kinase [Candidatus Limiplasma sp.]
MRKMVLGNVPTLDYACTEAMNTLATNVTFSGSKYRAIMTTSCIASEGKSFVTFHLVRTLANMGYSTLLVDADLRKSVFFSRYDVRITGPRTGLSHYLAGRSPLEDVLYQTNLPNVFVIPAGREVINSLPLLTSAAFVNLLHQMKKGFDFVIVDAPPVGLLIDAAMVASTCDATILVVSGDKISRRELIEAKQQIEKSGCTLLGAVLNKVSMETHKSRKYYYKSYYSHYGAGSYASNAAEEETVPREARAVRRVKQPGEKASARKGASKPPKLFKSLPDADGAEE